MAGQPARFGGGHGAPQGHDAIPDFDLQIAGAAEVMADLGAHPRRQAAVVDGIGMQEEPQAREEPPAAAGQIAREPLDVAAGLAQDAAQGKAHGDPPG
jgi:hypothetical protein